MKGLSAAGNHCTLCCRSLWIELNLPGLVRHGESGPAADWSHPGLRPWIVGVVTAGNRTQLSRLGPDTASETDGGQTGEEREYEGDFTATPRTRRHGKKKKEISLNSKGVCFCFYV